MGVGAARLAFIPRVHTGWCHLDGRTGTKAACCARVHSLGSCGRFSQTPTVGSGFLSLALLYERVHLSHFVFVFLNFFVTPHFLCWFYRRGHFCVARPSPPADGVG